MTHFSSLKQVFGIALLCGTVLIAKGGESRDYLRSNLASSWNPGDEFGGCLLYTSDAADDRR